MRKAALVILYLAVVLLVTVPPVFASLMSKVCMNPTGGSCRAFNARDWFAGDLATIWMPPFALAVILIFVIRYLHKAGRKSGASG